LKKFYFEKILYCNAGVVVVNLKLLGWVPLTLKSVQELEPILRLYNYNASVVVG
jgi:hypothetical protein